MSKVSRSAIAEVVAGKLLDDSAKSTDLMQALAAYLIENDMVKHADVIMNDIAEELFTQAGLLTVEVTSAHELTSDARTKLAAYLKSATGAKTVLLHETTNKSLIGGLIAKTPSAELDTSVHGILRQLKTIAA